MELENHKSLWLLHWHICIHVYMEWSKNLSFDPWVEYAYSHSDHLIRIRKWTELYAKLSRQWIYLLFLGTGRTMVASEDRAELNGGHERGHIWIIQTVSGWLLANSISGNRGSKFRIKPKPNFEPGDQLLLQRSLVLYGESEIETGGGGFTDIRSQGLRDRLLMQPCKAILVLSILCTIRDSHGERLSKGPSSMRFPWFILTGSRVRMYATAKDERVNRWRAWIAL